MATAQKIKVLHLVTRMNVGGVAVLLDNLMSNINKDEFEVLLATGLCESPEGEYLENRKVGYRIDRLPNFHKSINFADDFKSLIAIAKLIRKFNPDVVHTHTSKAGLFGRLITFFIAPSAKRIHTFHGHLLVGYFSPVKLAVVKAFEKSLGLLTHRFIAMGTQVRDDLVAVGIGNSSKFAVLFPGLAKPNFPERSQARSNLKLDDKKIYCAFVGRLTQIKRPDRVLEVAALVAKQRTDVEFLVVGDGELAQDMKSHSEKANLPITFLGWRQDIPAILKASDIALLTSDNEAVALTLIEATQAGIPLVTTSAGSVRDVAINGENGFVIGFNSQELANAVLKLAENPALREEFGSSGKKRSDALFSIERMVTDHENLYKELLRK
ncbi:RfaG Glycosyltransferase [Candidatus Planktophila dulcis]|uniref:glycosyltransferase n=1 Tax=Candidatus Planktophila dulcis TaxID=1884914 RepID=UPI003BEEBAE4